MSRYSLSHLSDGALLSGLKTLVARDRATTAEILSHIAEVDERRLFVPAGFPSMHAYCVGELGFCEQAAFKRIRAARAARRLPAIFTAVAGGRLHLSGLCLLAPLLTTENARELLRAAEGRSKAEVERLVAEWAPRLETPTLVGSLAPPKSEDQLSPGTVEGAKSLSPGTVSLPGPARIATTNQRPRVEPIAPQRYFLQLTMSQEMHDKLRHAQALLGHQIPSGDEAKVLERLLDLAIVQLEKRKFAASDRPGRPRPSRNPRHIPAEVRRAVRQRDGFQCTFVSESGRRCTARKGLEFDHVEPVARGGKATVENVRLRCRTHNQYAAERVFGVEFMRFRRKARRRPTRECGAEVLAREAAMERAAEVIPYLRKLGFRAFEARQAADHCAAEAAASLEDRVRAALSYLAPARPMPPRFMSG